MYKQCPHFRSMNSSHCPYFTPIYNSEYWDQETPAEDESQYYFRNEPMAPSKDNSNQPMDFGPEPYVVNINEATKENNNFRTALWTGKHLQLTLMSIDVGGEIGLEIHPNVDQFLRIEDGQGLVKMGTSKNNLNFQRRVSDDFAILIPAGTWHNVVNTGDKPLKLYSIYAPPQHPHGTVHVTKADAEAAEAAHHH